MAGRRTFQILTSNQQSGKMQSTFFFHKHTQARTRTHIQAERTPVRYHWGHPGRNAESAWHSHRKELPGFVPKMEETVGPVSTCGRELLRGWRRPIGLMVSFMVFTASVRKILDPPTYQWTVGTQDALFRHILNAETPIEGSPNGLVHTHAWFTDLPGCVLSLRVFVLNNYCESSDGNIM